MFGNEWHVKLHIALDLGTAGATLVPRSVPELLTTSTVEDAQGKVSPRDLYCFVNILGFCVEVPIMHIIGRDDLKTELNVIDEVVVGEY